MIADTGHELVVHKAGSIKYYVNKCSCYGFICSTDFGSCGSCDYIAYCQCTEGQLPTYQCTCIQWEGCSDLSNK